MCSPPLSLHTYRPGLRAHGRKQLFPLKPSHVIEVKAKSALQWENGEGGEHAKHLRVKSGSRWAGRHSAEAQLPAWRDGSEKLLRSCESPGNRNKGKHEKAIGQTFFAIYQLNKHPLPKEYDVLSSRHRSTWLLLWWRDRLTKRN